MPRSRRALLATLVLLAASPAAAQHWNDAPPGRDLLSSVPGEFDAFRQRVPMAPRVAPATAGSPVDVLGQPRDPIPILDWTTPQAAAPAATPRRTTTRRAAPRRAPVQQDTTRFDPAPAPIARAATPTGGADWERSLAERERELERLRQQLQQDRLRYEQARQPTLQ